MIALLLNSGRGTRMGAETRLHPKCMTALDEKDTIISQQVRLLRNCGIREAVVTTGPFAELLKEHLESLNSGIRFTYVPNPKYAETNYIYSMALAREALRGQEVISLHGDLVIHPEVMAELTQATRSCVAVDSTLPLPPKDFKARLAEGRIAGIGIDLFGEDCVSLQPAYHFLPEDFERWMREIDAFVQRGETGCYAENAFNAVWREIPLYPLECRGRLCAEIDNMEDHQRVTALYHQLMGE